MTWPIFGDHDVKIDAIERAITSGDDIVTAVIGGTLLEEAVERTLKERLRNDAKVAKNLFDIDKPLSNVAAQIDKLYLLWCIEEPARDTMRAIARVRNMFAHNLAITFESAHKDMVKSLSRMRLHEVYTHYPDARFGTPTSLKVEEAKNNRRRFLVNLKLSLNLLMQDRCKHETHSTESVSHEELRKRVGDPKP